MNSKSLENLTNYKNIGSSTSIDDFGLCKSVNDFFTGNGYKNKGAHFSLQSNNVVALSNKNGVDLDILH